MGKLPALKYREIEKILRKLGFSKVRQKGSHVFFAHEDGRTTVVPDHGRKAIGKGLLHKILNDIQISTGEFVKWKRRR